MLQRVKNKFTGQIFYFRFFPENKFDEFWYTPTTEACDFCLGRFEDFEPINKTWKELQKES